MGLRTTALGRRWRLPGKQSRRCHSGGAAMLGHWLFRILRGRLPGRFRLRAKKLRSRDSTVRVLRLPAFVDHSDFTLSQTVFYC